MTLYFVDTHSAKETKCPEQYASKIVNTCISTELMAKLRQKLKWLLFSSTRCNCCIVRILWMMSDRRLITRQLPV